MRHRKRIEGETFELVFSHLDGAPMLRFDHAWQVACEAAGIKDFHFHDLRHTFCSNLLLSGTDLKDVKEMIGHADIGRRTSCLSACSTGRSASRSITQANPRWIPKEDNKKTSHTVRLSIGVQVGYKIGKMVGSAGNHI